MGFVVMASESAGLSSESSHLEDEDYWPMLFASLFWLVFTAGRPLESAGTILVLWIVGGIGLQLLRTAGLIDEMHGHAWTWRLGPGVVLGLLVLYVLRLALTKDVFLIAFAVVGTVELTRLALRVVKVVRSGINVNLASTNVLRSFRLAAASTFLLGFTLVRSWIWVTPILIGVGLLWCVFASDSLSRFIRVGFGFLSATLFVAACVLSVALRGAYWWIPTDNQWQFEALSWSLIETGPRVNIFSAAATQVATATYHNASYFLVGLIDVYIDADSWVSLSRYAPIALSLVTTASIFALFREVRSWLPSSSSGSRYLAVGLLFVLVPITLDNLSNLLGLAAVTASVAVASSAARRQDSWLGAMVLASMIPATAISKAPFLYASLLVIVCSSLLRVREKWRSMLIATAVGVLLLVILRLASPLSGDFALTFFDEKSLFEFSEGSFAVRLLALAVVAAPISSGFVIALHLLGSGSSQHARPVIAGLLLVLVVGYLSRFVTSGRYESIQYAWMPATIASGLLVASICFMTAAHGVQATSNKRSLAASLFSVVVALLVLPQVVPNLDSGSFIAKLLRFLRIPDFILLAVCIAVLLYSIVWKKDLGSRHSHGRQMAVNGLRTALIVAVSGLTATANVAPELHQSFQESLSGVTDSERVGWVGSSELIEASRYLRSSTEDDSLIAITLSSSRAYSAIESAFPAYSRRRFLSVGKPVWPSSAQELIDARRSIATSLTELLQVESFWRSRGADYGVIDLALIGKWESELSRVVFENSKYQIVKLGS